MSRKLSTKRLENDGILARRGICEEHFTSIMSSAARVDLLDCDVKQKISNMDNSIETSSYDVLCTYIDAISNKFVKE